MPSLRDSEADLAFALSKLEGRTSYAEVLSESSSGAGLRMDRQTRGPLFRPEISGAVFRAWAGDRWAETAISSLARGDLAGCAADLAAQLPATARAHPPPGASETGPGEGVTPVHRDPAELSIEGRLELVRRFYDWSMAVPGITNTLVRMESLEDERLFLSTAGARKYQRQVRVMTSIVPLAIENGKVEYDLIVEGGSGGLEMLDGITEERVRAVSEESKRLLTAKAPITGKMAVILDPGTAGTFAHESFGHGTEADQLLRDRSYLKPILGSEVGPESLTLVDDGSYPGGWGSIFFDDEGVRAQRTVLVDRGRFVEVLHDRESAAAMDRRPTGNARRADFLSRPFVRMTNTFVEPGDWSLDELVQEAKDGVVLESCTSGIEDPLGGNMQIKVKKGRRIENGKLTDLYSSLALSGKVLEVLRNVRGVGKKDEFSMGPGMCGKGHTDLLPAGTGGVYMLTEAIVGPA